MSTTWKITAHAPNAVVQAQDHLPRKTPRIVPTVKPNAAKRPNAAGNFPSLENLSIIIGRNVTNSTIRCGIRLMSFHSDLVSSPAPTSKTPCRIINKLNIADITENKTDTAKAICRELLVEAGTTELK